MDVCLGKLSAASNRSTIKFGGLGCEGRMIRAVSCLEYNIPGGSFGLIVDPHMVMEHVQVNILGQDYLGRLERLYKPKYQQSVWASLL
jgi:hypothetical protein